MTFEYIYGGSSIEITFDSYDEYESVKQEFKDIFKGEYKYNPATKKWTVRNRNKAMDRLIKLQKDNQTTVREYDPDPTNNDLPF